MLRRSLGALSIGALAGFCAGTATACADFGAHWLFMESAGDRAWLGLRLLSLQIALGVLLGAALGPLVVITRALGERWSGDRGWAGALGARAAAVQSLLLAGLISPALATLAQLLWSGGKMSRFAQRDLGIGLTTAVLTLGLGATCWLGTRLHDHARAATPRGVRNLVLVLAALGFVIGKLNQLVLPNLYGYLHTSLSLAALGVYAFAASLVLIRAWDDELGARRWLWIALPLTAAALGAGYASFHTLEQNQNVRVALLSSDMPHSRALLQAATPWLPKVDTSNVTAARERAASARERRARDATSADFVAIPDAHVLLITIDALRADHLGFHGYKRPLSPELNALSQQGVVFEHAYAQAPHSSYSLCSLMTSEYLHETTELGLTPPERTLPRVLADDGYHTAGFYTQGIFHTAAEQLSRYEKDAFGFALHDHQDRPAEQMTDRALEEIDRTLSRGEPSALFWVHYFDVHEPYEATTFGTRDVDRYDSELLAADTAIGRLVREARARLKKPVVVVVTADHGEEFHEHGGVYHGSSLYEEQLHVPLLIIAPGVPARRIAQPVESIDIAPTLLGLLGVERPSSMRGTDLRRLWSVPDAERGPVFAAVIHKKMVVSWPYKLIADLRFDAYELYNLALDPAERDNLADSDPARVRSLRGEVYAWLDALEPDQAALSHHAQALEWGRLGDRRAVEPLSELVGDSSAREDDRCEAARLLGKLADPLSADRLLLATRTPDSWVGAEAAIALGRMFDERASIALRSLVSAEDPGVRSRAAVSLGRLRDKAAVPALIDALWYAPNLYEREEAVRWLGRLRDPIALDALLNLLPEPHTRHLVVIALGELGDARAFNPLVQLLESERNTNVRDGVVRGLSMLGDARALPVLVPLITDDPALRNTAEALVRLHALERKLIGGTDLDPSARNTVGFGQCQRGPWHHDWDFLHRTYCETDSDRAALRVPLPARVIEAPEGNVLLIECKRSDGSASVPVELLIGERHESLQVDGTWHELRFNLAHGTLPHGPLRVEFRVGQPGARLAVDHVLVVPRGSTSTM